MFTLILTIQTSRGCCVHSVPGFSTYAGATQAGEYWVKDNQNNREFHVVRMDV